MTEFPMGELAEINSLAHINTFHPNALSWDETRSDAELDYLSRFCFEESGHGDEAVAYLTKEFGQLAELERHVSATMALILSEFQASSSALGAGFDLHHAMSCFGAEELQHANTFYRWVRELSGVDVKLGDNLFGERLAVYQRDVAPEVKLAALCSSVYVGESVTVVFEHRAEMLDPDRRFLFSRLLHLHGLDEARHIKLDHFVIEKLIPSLSREQYEQVQWLLHDHVQLNQELGRRFDELVADRLATQWYDGNVARDVELALFERFEAVVYSDDGIRTVDTAMGAAERDAIRHFSGQAGVHA